jgi:ribosomal 50S subunit-recycling heat shock protein
MSVCLSVCSFQATQTVTCSNGKLLELRLAKKELEVEIATLKSQLAAEKDKAKESIAKTEVIILLTLYSLSVLLS